MSGTKEASEIKVKVGVSLGELVSALRKLSEVDKEFFIENLLAATSPAYLWSIQEAREDYRQGRTVPWEEAFQEASYAEGRTSSSLRQEARRISPDRTR